MPRISWKMGRVAGIDLYLNPTFLLVPALGYFEGGLSFMLLIVAVFGCVLLHEFGHAFAALAYGIRTRDITLYPIGGIARLERMPKAAGPELLITLAGPMVNVAIAAVLYAAIALASPLSFVGQLPYLVAFASDLMMLNLFLAAFNMVPAFPMDGGRVLRAILTGPLGRYRATEIAVAISRFIAIAFVVYALFSVGFWQAFPQLILTAFIFYAAGAELFQVRREEYERRYGTSQGIWVDPPEVRWVDRGNGVWQAVPIQAEAKTRGTRSWN